MNSSGRLDQASLCFPAVRKLAKTLARARSFGWAQRERLRERRLAGSRLIRGFAALQPPGFFVEIGANDGRQQDHLGPVIATGGWRGLMVEPQPAAFERLAATYGANPAIALENSAIAEHDGRLPFYEISPPAPGQEWELVGSYDLLGSLSREALVSHAGWVSDLEERIVVGEVECLSFTSLLARHSVERIDLLVLDTEGYDHEILKTVPLATLRPRLVVYEQALLGEPERRECRTMLERLGYGVFEEWLDSFCLDLTIDDRLTRLWRRLEPRREPLRLR